MIGAVTQKGEAMNDLISRQAAIKAVEDLPNCYNGFSDTYDKACIIGVLEEVPPEVAKDISVPTKWIPCEERLPEDEQEILFSTKTGRVHSGRYHDDNSANQWYSHRDWCRAWNYEVIAWMPLPEPYKGEEG